MRDLINNFKPWFWGLSVGIICLYLFGLIMGVFSPGQLWAWTAVVVVLAVLTSWHALNVRRALKAGDPDLRRAEGHAREQRGF